VLGDSVDASLYAAELLKSEGALAWSHVVDSAQLLVLFEYKREPWLTN
jgi:hypothetical protein